jgi:hypothetical protein
MAAGAFVTPSRKATPGMRIRNCSEMAPTIIKAFPQTIEWA